MISEKIVVIDDDAKILAAFQVIFYEHEIIKFTDPKKAIEFFKKPNAVSLVLLDVCLGSINGIDVLSELKRIDKDISIIIMTAFGSKEVAIDALRAHADDFVEKPFDVVELRDKVNIILREKSHLRGLKNEDRAERMKRFIEKNYHNVSLTALADEMCKSPKYMSRLFRERNKYSFRDYKVKIKMDEAKQLLKNSPETISQIAEKVGYQNPESFMRIFKKVIKCTPSQYRRQSRLQSGRDSKQDENNKNS